MTDALSTDLTPAEAPEVSTQLDDPRASDPAQAQHKEPAEPKPEAKKPESRLEAIKRAAQDVEKAEPDEKAKDGPEGAETAPEGDPDKEAGPPKEAEPKKPEQDKSERRHPEPPKNFLPRAKEKWLNVPYDVKTEIERMTKDHESEVQKHAQASERYEKIRNFDELAQRNGRDLGESLAKVNEIENLMVRSPLAGLNAVLQELGPAKPDGQKFSLFEIAQHIVQAGPDGYQQMMAQARQAPQQQQQPNQEVEQLRQQMTALQQQQLVASVIDPFRAAHDRFDELQDDIEFFLQSGKIPSNLSLHDRLAAAYDMADRINPASRVARTEPEERSDPERRAGDFGGSKSVKGAPATGVDVSARRKSKMSRAEAIQAAMADAGLVN